MISRFSARRLLCCLMAILTLFCALSPAFFQPAEAVAVADDIIIASLGLLAASWAGLSFSTAAGAQTAISSLLSSKPVVKASLAGLLTKELVVEGSKLLITSDVRDVFKTVLPEIRDFFKLDSDTVVSAGGGTLFSVVIDPVYIDVPSNVGTNFFYAYEHGYIPDSLFYQYSMDFYEYALFPGSYKTSFVLWE